MNTSKRNLNLSQARFRAVFAILLVTGLVSTLCFAQPQTNAPPSQADSGPPKTNAIPAQVSSAATNKPVKRQLSGAELYSMHCNRCHPERYPTERTAAQWKTIMLHMQVRANLPPPQARQILKYLQDNSGR
jgi:hypothetical protein